MFYVYFCLTIEFIKWIKWISNLTALLPNIIYLVCIDVSMCAELASFTIQWLIVCVVLKFVFIDFCILLVVQQTFLRKKNQVHCSNIFRISGSLFSYCFLQQLSTKFLVRTHFVRTTRLGLSKIKNNPSLWCEQPKNHWKTFFKTKMPKFCFKKGFSIIINIHQYL